jgi:ribosomal protein S12 methylthiotransferase accessory factor
MSTFFNTHKERDPISTINNLRNILANLGILTIESSWRSAGEHNFSVHIHDSNFSKAIGTNGKGVSKEYALASAYGEYMERLQNGVLYKQEYGLKDELMFNYPDVIGMSWNKYLENSEVQSLVSNLFEGNFTNDLKACGEEQIELLPFYGVEEKNIIYLPNKILNNVCGTNGMCAGNTPSEAISQGICEIFERYVLRRIFLDNAITYADIPIDYLKKFEVFRLIETFQDEGYHVVVKDLTLGGRYPVIGLIIFDDTCQHYKMAMASDSLFETALQRCCTEIFQGYKLSDAPESMVEIDFSEAKYIDTQCSSEEKSKLYEFQQCFYRNNGVLPNSILLPSKSQFNEENINKAFILDFISQEELLTHLLRILRINGHNLYVRDVSFLDFPTYRLYIPGLSEIFKTTTLPEVTNYYKMYKRILAMPSLSIENISDLFTYFENRKNDPKYRDIFERIFTNCDIDFGSDLIIAKLPFQIIRFIFSMIVENYTSAKLILIELLSQYDLLEDYSYYQCMLQYLLLVENGVQEEQICPLLSSRFPDNTLQIVFSHINNPSLIMSYFDFPECSKCNQCGIISNCKYSEWKRITQILCDKVQNYFPSQDRMSLLFK